MFALFHLSLVGYAMSYLLSSGPTFRRTSDAERRMVPQVVLRVLSATCASVLVVFSAGRPSVGERSSAYCCTADARDPS